LQALFQISDKQADRLAQQVVTKLVQQMMEKAGDGDQEGLLAALAGQEGMPGMAPGMGGMPTNPQEQMAALRELVDSGQLTDDDKREIKKMFAESLGGGDVDEKIREANKNRDQLDAQAREALPLDARPGRFFADARGARRCAGLPAAAELSPHQGGCAA